MIRSSSLLLPALLAAALPALGGFAQTEQRVKLAPAQRAVTVTFRTADGSRVTKASPDCSCTTVQLEGSRVVAQVDTSTFDAPITKRIHAETSDGRKSTLVMHFEVPQAVIISPASLVWERNAAPTPQEFRISLPKGSPICGLVSAGISGEDFDFSTRTISPGREYAVSITPRSTARRCMNRLVLKMDGPDPRYQQRILYIRVR